MSIRQTGHRSGGAYRAGGTAGSVYGGTTESRSLILIAYGRYRAATRSTLGDSHGRRGGPYDQRDRD